MNKKIYTNEVKKIPNFKINMEVTPYSVNYSWQELNCFYRPIATAFRAFNKNYFNLFLFWESFLKLYFCTDITQDIDESFFAFYEHYLEDVFNIKMSFIEIQNKDYFHNEIMASLNDGCLIIVPGDLNKLYYSTVYKKDHHKHNFLIRGYDKLKEIYFTLDNTHVDNGNSFDYVDFVIKYDDLINMNDSYLKFCGGKKQKYNYFLEIKKAGDTSGAFKKVYSLASRLLSDLTASNFVSHKYLEEIMINELNNNALINDLEAKLKLLNTRKVFYDMAVWLIKKTKQVKEKDLNSIIEYINLIQKQWEKIKHLMLYAMQTNQKNNKKLLFLINENKRKDLVLLKKINTVFSDYKGSELGDTFKEYIIKNNENALFFIDDKNLSVEHSYDKIYDTWITRDNAFQLLFKIKEPEFVCSTRIKSDSAPLGTYHFGIILKFIDGTKYLFGNEQNRYVSLFFPTNNGESTIYSEGFDYTSTLDIKVKSKKNELIFYIFDFVEKEYIIIKKIKIQTPVSYVGLFSKTWGNVKFKSIFSEFQLKVGNEIKTIK